MTATFWHVRNCSLFEHLDASQWELLEGDARSRTYARGSSIYLPTDAARNVFFLQEGRIRLSTTTPDGKLAISGFIEPGEIFGELALIEIGEREHRADATTKSTVVMISGDRISQLMRHTPSLTLSVTKLIGLRRKRVERRLRSLLFRSNRDRLMMLLINLVEQYGVADGDELRIGIKLSHQDLASLIGATRESVTHLLGELQLAGIIRYGRQWIVVRDSKELLSQTESASETVNHDARERTIARENRPTVFHADVS